MICRNCDKEFEPKKRGRKNTGFCCSKCRDAWNRKNTFKDKPKKYTKICEYCGMEYQTNQKEQKYCSSNCSHLARKTGRTVYEKECLYCGAVFETIHKGQKYCTSTCGARHAGDLRRGEYYCEYCGKPRWSDHPNRNRYCSRQCANKAKHLEALSKQDMWRQGKTWERNRNCLNCGNSFYAKHGNHRFCSSQCQYEAALRTSHEKNVEQFVPVLSVCPQCGSLFSTTFQAQRKKYCSRECERKVQSMRYHAKRKEQMRRAFVEPVGLKYTYLSYEGTCAICGLPVPVSSESTNQWAATVDHIMPLSQGGLHKKSNCQLAHRLCNSIKLDTVEDFHIDWRQKLIEEPGRWNEQLDDLWRQLGIDDMATI